MKCKTVDGRGKQMGKRGKGRRVANAILCILCLAVLAGCGKDGTRVVFTTGPKEDEVFLINNEACKLPELMVYLTTIQNQYQSVYGEEIWNASHNGVTLEENVKETVLARIAQVKTMYLLALNRGDALTEEEQGLADSAAGEYFESLDEREVELMGVDEETIGKLYQEYALADKVYREIIENVNPEISDDEARTITVQRIFRKNYYLDGKRRIPYSQAEKQEAYTLAEEIREMAVSGEKDFEELAAQYSEDDVITFSFRKGEEDAAIEQAAFELETGEVSPVVTNADGYYIIKCISTFDRAQTDANKAMIVEERRKEAFAREYDAFVATLVRQLNESLWERVSLIRDPKVTTMNFFEIYEKYF